MARYGLRTLAATVLAGGVAAAGLAQPGDLADKAKQAQLQAEAAAAADVAEAIKAAKKLANTFPDKALRDLKAATLKLNTAAGLSNARRESLSAQIDAAVAALQRPDAPDRAKPDVDPRVIDRMAKGRKQADAAAAEAKDVLDAVDEIAKDVDAGRDREARAKVADLTRKYPNNAAVVELGLQTQLRDSLAAARDISRRSADGFRVTMNSVQESAIPSDRDMTFPKDWVPKMKLRYEMNRPKLTAQEQKLLEAMNVPIKTELRAAPFEEAVQSLSTAIDQKIYIDRKALEDTGVDLKSTVSVPGGVTARSALRVMLQQQGLTFVIRDNVIQVVSLEQARKNLVTRAYDVRDIVSTGGPFNGLATWGPVLDAEQTYANAAVLVDAIKKSVDPAVWKETGNGPATVVFHYATMSVIVRAPSEVHAELYDKMYPPKR